MTKDEVLVKQIEQEVIARNEVRQLKINEEDPTLVELVTSTYQNGNKVQCSPRIVFKVVLFKNGKAKNCLLHVEPVLTDLGEITEQACTIRVIVFDKLNMHEEEQEVFSRTDIMHLSLSYCDTRLIKMDLSLKN